MKLTILYDNETATNHVTADWGFSCLVETGGRTILFDTGARGNILLRNMAALGLNPKSVDEIFISHGHWDHTGGLPDFLRLNPCGVYLPRSCQGAFFGNDFVFVDKPAQLHENIFSTGELADFEQSLVVQTDRGLVVVVGCSHPGVKSILERASERGRVNALIGGLHGFDQFEMLKGLEAVCPTHCTRYQGEIARRYPKKFLAGGVGRVITL